MEKERRERERPIEYTVLQIHDTLLSEIPVLPIEAERSGVADSSF